MEKIMLNKICIICLLLLATNSFAGRKPHITKEKIGQKYYLKRCSSCHGSGNRGGNLNTENEWREIFSKNAQELIELHIDEDNTQKIINYIKSNDFKKEQKKMLKFLQEFANDSDTIPTCY